MPEISIRAGTLYFGLYRAPTRKLWVKGVSKHINAAETRIYGSMEGLQENETCLEGTQLMKHLWNATYNSDIHFDNINTKFAWLNALDEYK